MRTTLGLFVTLLIVVIGVAIGAGVFYSLGAFIAADWNIANWSGAGRFCTAMLMLFGGIFGAMGGLYIGAPVGEYIATGEVSE